MKRGVFTDDDLKQIEEQGLTIEEVYGQIDLLKMSTPYLRLAGPCTPGDGIQVLDQERTSSMINIYEREAGKHHCVKFVPASGAASRMFKILLGYLHQGKKIVRTDIFREASAGKEEARNLLLFMDGAERFAFFKDIRSIMSEQGLDLDALLRRGEYTDLIRLLLTEDGLDYANLPKGLLKFHEYPEGDRTAFEEHLVEAVSYISDQKGNCPIHFTVSQEHMGDFEVFLEKMRPIYEEKYRVAYDVSFSTQRRSTDTIALDMDNSPFRKENGRLLFRPGGHGALLKNLNDLGGEIIFIKNIDNVVPDHLKPETIRWKKIMGGYLLFLERLIFNYIKRLASEVVDHQILDEITAFLGDELLFPVPDSIRDASTEAKKAYLMERLNRPIRVCGMVRNVGEPGGGPFWVEEDTGEKSLQIVESGQVDPDSKEQQSILAGSTHFNPVDLVCVVRDWQGRPFDLSNYVDPKAFLVSQKSIDGRDLKALERPGLWNGSMARWITVFVEVPSITFNPVKTVNDLLRKEHQPCRCWTGN